MVFTSVMDPVGMMSAPILLGAQNVGKSMKILCPVSQFVLNAVGMAVGIKETDKYGQ